ncbi:MAG: amidohydrolase family protein [Clostridia bacterium]|jgi:uncharacterized protein|nr:amidohydrolase family protein [Clostridia bacterium]MBT7122101.1 amidohydrolase family protein [Clostridia bacterium]
MFDQIHEFVSSAKVLNTHSHHYPDDFFADFNLDKLLRDSYIAWCDVEFDSTRESRENYLSKVRYKSYFVYLQAALKNLYNIDENLSADNWEQYSQAIKQAHKNSTWHKTILSKHCNYEKSILDAYWDPGSDNGDSKVFASTFRIDSLFFGFDKSVFNHNGHNAYDFYKNESSDIDEYMAFVRALIVKKISSGIVSLKNAMAYDRNIRYRKTTKQAANRVFNDKNYTQADVTAFQDYFFFEVCKIAAELDIPMQCHTGQGCLDDTRAIAMHEVITANPDTTFVLFHAGFPWCDDILALLHDCPNVYSDICWLPLLSPTTAKESLHKHIELGIAAKICWGGDTWTSEESYGARLAANRVIATVLDEKIADGYLNIDDAKNNTENLFYNNAKQLYKI